jgi:hypothetical protein
MGVLGLLLFAGGYVMAIVAMQEVFAAIASEDATNKARALADAVMRAERIKAVTRFTSPLGLALVAGGIVTSLVLRLRGSSRAGPRARKCHKDDQNHANNEHQTRPADDATHQGERRRSRTGEHDAVVDGRVRPPS